jgi:hypothetical protein
VHCLLNFAIFSQSGRYNEGLLRRRRGLTSHAPFKYIAFLALARPAAAIFFFVNWSILRDALSLWAVVTQAQMTTCADGVSGRPFPHFVRFF